jgi:hypothetical protein
MKLPPQEKTIKYLRSQAKMLHLFNQGGKMEDYCLLRMVGYE